ncbi:DedA family protein [Natrononativus amylolyticus]|uniref:DedA family protein n=1 Tax=Natrononativus amylolyticus TaxID=2963434 RepID=UPI0020CD32BF|nr:VTT domain-containing protein [Natrononativus amylolyticus]
MHTPLTALVDVMQTALQTVGLPALFAVFVLKGALIGKIFPTSVFLPGYVIATRVSLSEAVTIVLLVTVAHILGQLVIYLGVRRYDRSFLERLPYVEVDEQSDRYRRLDQWFDRYGGAAVFATNVVPWSRGLIAIPAAVSSYSTARYTLHVSTATLLYHAVYVGAAIAGVALVV